MENLHSKKVAFIIAYENFRDEEYFVPKEILEKQEAKVVTFSSKKGTALGMQGGEVEVNLILEDLQVNSFNAIVFIGGQGAQVYFENSQAYRIARETVEKNRVLGAICIAPAILAKAGVLKGKVATVWSSPLDKSAVKILQDNGAIWQNGRTNGVSVDGKIVTANGPLAAQEFVEEISKLLVYDGLGV